MYHLDLFSGIGGFALAAKRVWQNDHRVKAFCEIDAFCQKVLRKHWPDVPIIKDIRRLQTNDYKKIDLITGGFPCQPFSVAGRQRGKTDDRYLWPAMFKVIKGLAPRWVLCENVPGIIHLALDKTLVDLEGIGYQTETFLIPACGLNAHHRRDRIWVVAYPRSIGRHFFCEPSAFLDWQTTVLPVQSRKPRSRKIRRILQPLSRPMDKRWRKRVINGVPSKLDKSRIRSLGNAIYPDIAEVFFRTMKYADENLI